MKEMDFKVRLQNNQPVMGAMLSFRSPESAELMAACGFDFLMIDAEHSSFGPETVQDLIRAVQVAGCLPFVRVPETRAAWVQWALDAGAGGILFPQIRTADDARQAVALCRYPPQGIRGLGPGRASGYGATLLEYEESANRAITVMVQIENLTALEHLEEILAVPGIDLVFMGPGDLSEVLGVPGQLAHPSVEEAMNRILTHCKKVQIPAGTLALAPDVVKLWHGRGVCFFLIGSDAFFLSKASAEALGECRLTSSEVAG